MKIIKKYTTFFILLIFSFLILNLLFSKVAGDLEKTRFSQVEYFSNTKEGKKSLLILGNSTSRNINIKNLKYRSINASFDANSGAEYLSDFKLLQGSMKADSLILLFFTPWTFTREYYKHSIKSFLLTPSERINIYNNFKDIIFPIFFTTVFYSALKEYFFQNRAPKIQFMKRYNYKNKTTFKIKDPEPGAFLKNPSKLDIDAINKIKKQNPNTFLVIPPLHSSIRKKMIPSLEKFNLDFKVINYIDLIKENENFYFYDSSHLNVNGLRILEDQLNKDLSKIIQQ